MPRLCHDDDIIYIEEHNKTVILLETVAVKNRSKTKGAKCLGQILVPKERGGFESV